MVRPSRYPPLQFDWARLGSAAIYRAKPNAVFYLYAFRHGGSWRFSISMVGEGSKLTPLYDEGPYQTLVAAKHAAERWYIAHGGTSAQQALPLDMTEWEEVL